MNSYKLYYKLQGLPGERKVFVAAQSKQDAKGKAKFKVRKKVRSNRKIFITKNLVLKWISFTKAFKEQSILAKHSSKAF